MFLSIVNRSVTVLGKDSATFVMLLSVIFACHISLCGDSRKSPIEWALYRVKETPYARIQERRFIRPAQCARGNGHDRPWRATISASGCADAGRPPQLRIRDR